MTSWSAALLTSLLASFKPTMISDAASAFTCKWSGHQHHRLSALIPRKSFITKVLLTRQKSTWQAKTSWIVDLETCFAVAARTFPSVPSFNTPPIIECFQTPLSTCMTMLAASHREPMTEATKLAAETRPWDHWLSSLPCRVEHTERRDGGG